MSTIDPIDKLITEWSWRCEKGYPDLNNPKDMAILKEVLYQYDITLEEVEERIEEQEDSLFIEKLPLSQDDIALIVQTFNKLNDKDKQVVRDNFRKHSIESFSKLMKTAYNSYKPFFPISKKKGRGRGEFIPLLCIKDSKSGGTEDKDIIVGDTVLEIKELEGGSKFLTGKSGSIKKSKFSINIETYCRYLEQLGIEKGKNESVDFVIKYFHNQYVSGNVSNQFIAAIKDSVDIVRDLSPDDLEDNNLNYVKVGNRRFEFIIEPGKEVQSGEIIKLGRELEKSEAALSKLGKHPVVKDPDVLYDNYYQVVDKYLASINYFGIYPVGGSRGPDILTAPELKERLRKNYISTVQHNLRLTLSRNG